jgi:hypothetical protein
MTNIRAELMYFPYPGAIVSWYPDADFLPP